MRIQSKFKDYYDFVAHIYGGGDPKVMYLRDRIVPIDKYGLEGGISVNVHGKILPYLDHDRTKINIAWLVVCGKAYLLLSYKDVLPFQFHVVNEKDDKEFLDKFKSGKYSSFGRAQKSINNIIGVEIPKLVDISREIKQPIFLITAWNYNMIHISSKIPVLSNLGFPSLMEPEQLYQNIAYYISNVMVESADIKPPAEVSNNDRIQQYGFDLKQSFRHRKNHE